MTNNPYHSLLRTLTAVLLALVMSCAAENPGTSYRELVTTGPEFRIGPSNVCLPIGRILLIKSSGRLYAIRFVRALSNKEHDEFAATLELSNLMSAHWNTSTVQVEERQLRGFGHPFMFQIGNVRISLAPSLSLRYNGPSCISMYRYNTEEADQGIAFAPTAWESVSAVRMDTGRLSWYRVDLSRSVRVPLSVLPGY
jgi:hypothetical protein